MNRRGFIGRTVSVLAALCGVKLASADGNGATVYFFGSRGGLYSIGIDSAYEARRKAAMLDLADEMENGAWGNYTATYANVSKPDLVAKMRKAMRSMNWKPPVKNPYDVIRYL